LIVKYCQNYKHQKKEKMSNYRLQTNIIFRQENVGVDEIAEIEQVLGLPPNTIDLQTVPMHTKRVCDLIVLIGYPEKGHAIEDE
jgi:hypothetical protein